MTSSMKTLAGLCIVYAVVVTSVYCTDVHGTDMTKDQIVALTRDHFGRADPDALINGFFPVWAVIQFILAGVFLVITIISVGCYALGCRTPEDGSHTRIK